MTHVYTYTAITMYFSCILIYNVDKFNTNLINISLQQSVDLPYSNPFAIFLFHSNLKLWCWQKVVESMGKVCGLFKDIPRRCWQGIFPPWTTGQQRTANM